MARFESQAPWLIVMLLLLLLLFVCSSGAAVMMDATQVTWSILTSPTEDSLVGVPSVYSLVDDTALIHFAN